MNEADTDSNFSQSELDKFNELAHRWWGEVARLRTTGSRAAERTAMDGRAGVSELRGVAPWMAAAQPAVTVPQP